LDSWRGGVVQGQSFAVERRRVDSLKQFKTNKIITNTGSSKGVETGVTEFELISIQIQ
jgi:hypothetical protein